MKKFLFKISLYILPIFTLLLVLGSFADGNTDDNYRHFVGSAPSNIIIGDSRGVQALVPVVLNEKLKGKPFNNFAFNVADSPFGETYLNAIKKKVDPKTKNGIFILTVDPWSLSVAKNINSEKDFPETKSFISKMIFFNSSPNYEYLLKNYSRSWFKIFQERESKEKSASYLHKDGWMEITVDVHPDSLIMRETKKVKEYIEHVKTQKLSNERFLALNKIIQFLQTKGTVYIVRIPGSAKIMDLENQYFGEFNRRINEISVKNKVPYFDFSPDYNSYIYTDGNHMYKASSKIFTAQIADSIILYRNNLK